MSDWRYLVRTYKSYSTTQIVATVFSLERIALIKPLQLLLTNQTLIRGSLFTTEQEQHFANHQCWSCTERLYIAIPI